MPSVLAAAISAAVMSFDSQEESICEQTANVDTRLKFIVLSGVDTAIPSELLPQPSRPSESASPAAMARKMGDLILNIHNL
jgi:hypothetical protein